jgi:hypothetical protein
MSKDTIANIIVVSLGIALIAVLVGVGSWWKVYTCNARWESSGMKSEYRFVTGCMVEVTPGKLIPEEKYRAVE